MIWLYAAFVGFVLVMLTLDLGVVNRRAHVVRSRESLVWTGVTVVLAVLFACVLYPMYQHNWPHGIAEHVAAKAKPGSDIGFEAMTQFFAAWVTEYSLSVDNIFVIAVIFGFFRVAPQNQHRVLFWGILGALLMRGLMIGAGTEIIQRFDWVKYIFGAFLMFTAAKLLYQKDESPHPDRNIAVRLARRLFPVATGDHSHRFFVRLDGKLAMTPLFIVLLVIETTDVIFAVDSIPAAIGFTYDPFLVFTSNVFAILGLRSLYFALAAGMRSFRYLKVSLVFVLGFVGLKMILDDAVKIPAYFALPIILLILLGGVVASLFATSRERRHKQAPIEDMAEAVEITRRNLRRVFILIGGSAVILLGIAIAPIPGPGAIPLIIAGLMILATEFVWAQRLVRRLKNQTAALSGMADQFAQKTSPWVVPPVLLFAGAVMVAVAHSGIAPPLKVYLFSLAVWAPLLFWTWRVIVMHRRGITEQKRPHKTSHPAPDKDAKK